MKPPYRKNFFCYVQKVYTNSDFIDIDIHKKTHTHHCTPNTYIATLEN